MRIVSATSVVVFYVETNEENLNQYTRHSAENWTIQIGESDEQVYDCAKLESLFQEYLLNNK